MDYISLDIEATGLDTKICQPIEFSALFETPNDQKSFEDIPKFKRYIKWPNYIGEAYALQMNSHIFEILANKEGREDQQHLVCDYTEVVNHFCVFLESIGFKRSKGFFYLTVIGKNVRYDLELLETLPGWLENIKVRHRIGDPAILFVDWYSDKTLPNLSDCKTRANLDPHITHDSGLDAWDVIETCRFHYGEKPQLDSNN